MIRTSLILALPVLLVAACGGEQGYDPGRAAMTPPAPREMAMMQSDISEDSASPERGSGTTGQAVHQYIAYAHSIGLRLPVRSIEPALEGHIASCNAAGPSVCLVTSSNLYAYSEDEASGLLNLRATPEWIDAFLSGIDGEVEAVRGEVTNRQTTAEDLTVSLVDTGARLNAQILLQERLEQLLADRPGNLGELLDTQRELARVNGEIDSLTSTLAALRQRVDMSRLAVSYETRRNPVSQGALQPLGQAFGSFFYNLSSALAAVVTAFAVGLPWLLLIGALLWIWLRLIWPRIRRKKPGA